MEIAIMVGTEKVILRGGDKAYELCYPVKQKDTETEIVSIRFVPQKWYTTLPSAIDALLNMKIRASDANSLTELQQVIKTAREELAGMYEVA